MANRTFFSFFPFLMKRSSNEPEDVRKIADDLK